VDLRFRNAIPDRRVYNEQTRLSKCTDRRVYNEKTRLSKCTDCRVYNEKTRLSKCTDRRVYNEQTRLSKCTDRRVYNEQTRLSKCTDRRVYNEETRLSKCTDRIRLGDQSLIPAKAGIFLFFSSTSLRTVVHLAVIQCTLKWYWSKREPGHLSPYRTHVLNAWRFTAHSPFQLPCD
jgi:hypothetical protein